MVDPVGLLVVAVLAVIGFICLLLMWDRERSQKQEAIEKALRAAREKVLEEGVERGRKEILANKRLEMSQPIWPSKLPHGRYLVRFLIEEEHYPTAALATSAHLVYANKPESVVYESWFIALPPNRARPFPVPFEIVIDASGMCYEPYEPKVLPPPEPDKTAVSAA